MSPSRLSRRAGELLFANTAASKRITPLLANRGFLLQASYPFTTSQGRQGLGSLRQALEASTPRVARGQSPTVINTLEARNHPGNIAYTASSFLIPGTFILPPLSGFPKGLYQKLRFLGWCCYVKVRDMGWNFGLKFLSKPSLFARARLRAKRSTLIPTAKALHRAMAQAVASGDRDTINRICSRKVASTLVAGIDSRPRGRRYGWELVAYTNKLFYPLVKSHKLAAAGDSKEGGIMRQAVVAISSRQRRVEYDARGQVVPGSEKEIDAVEYIVLSCTYDRKTWAQSDWLVVGTTKPHSLEQWLYETQVVKHLMLRNK